MCRAERPPSFGHSVIGPKTFVASTTFSRRPPPCANQFPMIVSVVPGPFGPPYRLAVSDAPRDREMGERVACVGGNFLELLDRVELALVVLRLRRVHQTPRRAGSLGILLPALVLPGEPAPVERAPHDDAHSVALACR